jgi:hypothetical protein
MNRSLKLLSALVLCAGSAAFAQGPQGPTMSTTPPNPDPRVGLRAGLMDAAEATWNFHIVSKTQPSERFRGITNSDLAFSGQYVIQGSYNGFQVWDVTNPAAPALKQGFLCPASQSDVSVFRNLLFVSGEGNGGRLDCGPGGVHDSVSHDRLRGIRIFDITDIANPRYITNVQTCRGSHTHTVVPDINDSTNIYVYISGQAGVRSPNELAGCSALAPSQDPNSARFRIEVIQVPLAHPETAHIVSSPRIFDSLTAPPTHAEAPNDIAAAQHSADSARAAGWRYIAKINGSDIVLGPGFVGRFLPDFVKARGNTGAATAADSAAFVAHLQVLIDSLVGNTPATPGQVRPGPDQCHDITVYPAIGLAGGACAGYGLLLDIRDVAHPRRIGAVSDSNFSYWHSATFNNNGTKLLFSDEWGGGGGPKCRATDRPEWGADALFTIDNGVMHFHSYYKMLAPQTPFENCVAHNGSLVPIPGRDIMVQSWYQGGISMFEWTDASHPKEIAFFDRGPVDSTRMQGGGTWSAYWYNGYIYSSEIARGLDVLELQPSGFISQNEIDAAKSVRFDFLNVQSQPRFVWPASFALARAYVDQLERSNGLVAAKITATRAALGTAEGLSGARRRTALTQLATRLDSDATGAGDAAKVRTLAAAVRALARS